jgi:APA family basic amino acid/polyamine antiporter
LVPIVPLLGMIFSVVLITSLPPATWVRFVIWLVIGLIIYFFYSRHHSLLARGERGIERDMPA